MLFLQDALTRSGDKLTIPSGADPNKTEYMLDPGAMRSMRWGFTLALMSGAYYEIDVNGNHDTRWWYDEYDGGKGVRKRGYLGQPLGPPVRLRRAVSGDVTSSTESPSTTPRPESVTIDLKKPFRHLRGTQNPSLNDGRAVTRVTLPAHDGLILLNVEQKTKKK